MAQYLEEAPINWRRPLVLSAVPKDGELYEDNFSVSTDKQVSYWGQIFTLLSDLHLQVRAFRSSGRIIVTVALEGEVSAPCARCLEPAKTKINEELRYIFSLRGDEVQLENNGEDKFGEEEITVLDSWEDEIDLAPLIWETFISALPAVVLCSPDCRGICPKCGANLNHGPCGCKEDNHDPRFDVLKTLMKEQDN